MLKKLLGNHESRKHNDTPKVAHISQSYLRAFDAVFKQDHAQGRGIKWGAVAEMVGMINGGQSAEEGLELLKRPSESASTARALMALTVLDTLKLNCPAAAKHLCSRSWQHHMGNLATSSRDAVVRSAAAQLVSNWLCSEGELGAVYGEVQRALQSQHVVVPSPFNPPKVTGQHGIILGLDFMASLNEVTRQVAQSQESLARVDGETVDAIRRDTAWLLMQMQQVRKAHDARKAGGDIAHVQKALAECSDARDQCMRWTSRMEDLLMTETNEMVTAQLLEANDALVAALEQQSRLAAANVGDPSTSLADLDEQLGNLGLGHETTREAWAAEYSNIHMKQLQEEVTALEQRLDEAAAERDAALKAAEARHEAEVCDLKGKAVRRVKELMAEVEAAQEEKRDLEKQLAEVLAAQQAQQSSGEGNGKVDATALQEAKAALQAKTGELLALKRDIRQLKAELASRDADIEDKAAELVAINARHESALAELRAAHASSLHELTNLRESAAHANEMKARATLAEQQMVSMKLELKKESILRKKAHNQIREMKGNIRVLARIRPASVTVRPDQRPEPTAMSTVDEYTLNLVTGGRGDPAEGRRFEFDAVFPEHTDQKAVYAEVQELVQSAHDGFNVCIFCYGQTGSGKTYTMTGSADEPGVIPRAMRDIFDVPESSSLAVQAYMLELYQDKLLDLLSPKDEKLNIKTDARGLVGVEGAQVRGAQTADDLLAIFHEGLSRRKTASTKLNIESSRSHLIFTVLLSINNTRTGARAESKLTFVDLAGSERVARSGAVDDKTRLDEARAINLSLSALGDVVSALTTGEKFIPYRNHRLTELMRDSLGGNAKTLMFINVSPLESDAAESKNSLEYASRVKNVTNEASRNFETQEITRLKAVIESLKKKCSDAA